MINGTPQVAHLAIHLHAHLIQVPPPMAETPHVRDAPFPDLASKHRTKPVPPEAYRLVSDVDPLLEQQSDRAIVGAKVGLA
ncbi:MAG TPA: hypothetical protein VF637_03890 [Sphingomicrobium sp.]